MSRTRIKICGVTRPEDAQAAARTGADAIGIVLHKESKRGVTVDIARKIVAAVPPFVTPVALFVEIDPQEILDTAAALNIRTVQLQGPALADDIDELRGLTVLTAIHVSADTLSDDLSRWREAIAERELHHLAGIVLDTDVAGATGGTGVANDWRRIREAQDDGKFKGLPPIIAAGGLTPQSVAQVIREIQPYAVDVSSGVESAVGQKSVEKLEAFVRAVREADG